MSIVNFKINYLPFASAAALFLPSVGNGWQGTDQNEDTRCFSSNAEDCGALAAWAQNTAAQTRACLETRADAYLSGMINKTALQNTPNYVHQMMHPGNFYTVKGQAGFKISEDRMLSKEEFVDTYRTAADQLKTYPHLQLAMKEQCPSEEDRKGCPLILGDKTILIDVDKRKMDNHRAMVESFRSWVGKLDTLSVEEIEAHFLKSHSLLFQNMDMEQTTGIYRDKEILVFQDNEEDRDRSPRALTRLVLQRGGSQADAEVIKKYMTSKSSAMRNLTPQERAAWSWIAFVPCSPNEVPSQMRQFFQDLQSSLREMKDCGRVDPLALGLFVHQTIGKIHPFADGNGRAARALMNAILMEHGIDPIVFFNDAAYTAAIQKDDKNLGYFTQFVTKEVLPLMERYPERFPRSS